MGKGEQSFRSGWEQAVRHLRLRPPTRKLVALVLATYANPDGTSITVGENTLAACCGISARAARGHRAALLSVGLLARTSGDERSRGYGVADTYRLAMTPALRQAATEARPTGPLGPVHGRSHRTDSSGAEGPGTGTSVPDHRTHSAHHRNVSAGSTGTTGPATTTGTKTTDQPTTTDNSSTYATSGGRAPGTARPTGQAGTQAPTPHPFEDGEHGDCQRCPLPERHHIHRRTR